MQIYGKNAYVPSALVPLGIEKTVVLGAIQAIKIEVFKIYAKKFVQIEKDS